MPVEHWWMIVNVLYDDLEEPGRLLGRRAQVMHVQDYGVLRASLAVQIALCKRKKYIKKGK